MHSVNKGAYTGLEFSEKKAKAFYETEGLKAKKTSTTKRRPYRTRKPKKKLDKITY